MKAKKLLNNNPKVYVVVFETGDEVMHGITQFAREHNIPAASFTAIGAFSKADIGYFDFAIKDYKSIPIQEQMEVLSLIGDIIQYNDEPKVHAHVVIGKADGTAHGGHLIKAFIKPTLEVVITELPAYLHRELDEETGLPLIKL